MAVESFVLTTLPVSAHADDAVHVSLFVTHRLTPDGDSGRVRDFPTVARWGAAIRDSTLTLVGTLADGSERTVPCTLLLDAVDPRLWPGVFPADLVVRPWETPDLTDSAWHSFPAKSMESYALTGHLLAMWPSYIDPPLPSKHPLLPAAVRRWREHVEDLRQDGPNDPRPIRYALNDNDVVLERFRRLDLLTETGTPSDDDPWTSAFLDDVAQVARFYARSEDAQPYRERPEPDHVWPAVEPPTPDFHERASMLHDLSPLLRRLGIVVDVRVDDVAALAGLTRIRARLAVPGLEAVQDPQPATRCLVRGTRFTAQSLLDAPEVAEGALRLGDPELFTTLRLDPDASGLKLDQFVGNLVPSLLSELNGDPVHAAPPALRATGLSIARTGRSSRLQDQAARGPDLDLTWTAGDGVELGAEDVTRGLRLEVWDDVSGEWRSLHRRRLTVEVVDTGTVLADTPDIGFVQGSNVTQQAGSGAQPDQSHTYAHEVIAGWDGWSLSAPRPGRTSVHEPGQDGEPGRDVVQDAPAEPATLVNPVRVTTRVEPGTLPWLRYGRSYSFRAWTVDLAGNGGAPRPATTRQRDEVALDPQHLGELAERAVQARAARPGTAAVPALPPAAFDALVAAAARTGAAAQAGRSPDGNAADATGPAEMLERVVGMQVSQALRALVAERLRPALPSPSAVLRSRIDAASAGLREVLTEPAGYAGTTAAGAEVLRQALAAHLSDHALGGQLSLEELAERLDLVAVDTVTEPTPFLRWDPIVEPAVVPRAPYSEGESLLTLVIRSGIDVEPSADPGGEQVPRVVDPATYAGDVLAAHPGLGLHWRATSERHLAPPKVAQLTAEQHGAFDAAFGGGPADVKKALALALREAGTFDDTVVADLDEPGRRVPVAGVKVVSGPTADPPPADATPPRGTVKPAGTYVVHDVDVAEVPYLPDPLAAGIALTFPDADPLPFTGTRLEYAGTWPRLVPWRLSLAAGPVLGARTEGNALRVGLPAGEQLTLDLSSALRRDDLDLLGLWRGLPDVLKFEGFDEAAVRGWFWWLTPAVRVRLVHATPRPVEAPHLAALQVLRRPGDTSAPLIGGITVHGPSTDAVDLEATWTETVDDPAAAGPTTTPASAAVAHLPVLAKESLALVLPPDGGATSHWGAIGTHAVGHTLGDTRHRVIGYRARATSRYREYFDPRVFSSADDTTLLSATRTLQVPSSARPPKPVVRDILPLFLWDEQTQPGQPFALRRTRRGGLRLYLARPWYATGEGELLGVVLAGGEAAADYFTTTSRVLSDARFEAARTRRAPFEELSHWAADPAFPQQGPGQPVLPGQGHLLTFDDLVAAPDRPVPGRPVPGSTVTLPLVRPGATDTDAHVSALAGSFASDAGMVGGQARELLGLVTVVGYAPQYSEQRGLWFVDIPLDTGTAYWPFVSLAVTRYQPHSLAGLHLSPVVRCHMMQVPAPRQATLSRPDDSTAFVTVTGPASDESASAAPRRRMVARLERRTGRSTDLGWTTVSTRDLEGSGTPGRMTWEASLALPEALPVARPGGDATWRVTLEEWESVPADGPDVPVRTERVVYADHLPL